MLSVALFGYSAQHAEIGAMLNGGGVISMLNIAVIVCLSSAYLGIFQKTGLIHPLQQVIVWIGHVITPFSAVLITSVLTGLIACNQTLTIILTYQLCEDLEPAPSIMANDL